MASRSTNLCQDLQDLLPYFIPPWTISPSLDATAASSFDSVLSNTLQVFVIVWLTLLRRGLTMTKGSEN